MLAVLGCLVGSGITTAAAPARAETLIGADLDYALPMKSEAESGGGFAVRLGWQLHLPMLVITPEAAFNYVGFSGTYEPSVYRGLGGVRVGIGEVFRIGASAHFGVAHLTADGPDAAAARTGFTYDLGALFDFTLLPLLNLGVHAAYNQIPGSEDPSFQWMTVGGHVELIF